MFASRSNFDLNSATIDRAAMKLFTRDPSVLLERAAGREVILSREAQDR